MKCEKDEKSIKVHFSILFPSFQPFSCDRPQLLWSRLWPNVHRWTWSCQECTYLGPKRWRWNRLWRHPATTELESVFISCDCSHSGHSVWFLDQRNTFDVQDTTLAGAMLHKSSLNRMWSFWSAQFLNCSHLPAVHPQVGMAISDDLQGMRPGKLMMIMTMGPKSLF